MFRFTPMRKLSGREAITHGGYQPNTLTVDFSHFEKGIYFFRSGPLVTRVVLE